jgi:HAE1 family hydrophobic/amphiphilic exporter-1
MLGFIILLGVVVNNAILVVHQALNFMDPARGGGEQGVLSDQEQMEAFDPTRAIAESVKTRFRPIMMSMLTTTFGLFPLVVSSGAGSELYRGIGSIVLGGLVTSTIFTLVLVPALFSLMMDLKKMSGKLVVSKPAISHGLGEV